MSQEILLGAGVVLIAGVLQGLFAVPMKFARCWQYENIWLVFAFFGLVVFPWILTFSTVSQVGRIYSDTSIHTLVAIVGFGICWGIGATLTGLALNMLGIGLAMAIILGLSASVGSLIPLLILTPAKLGTAQGRLYLVGTAVMLGGISIASRAGALRDRLAHAKVSKSAVENRSSFIAGLIIATLSGLFSSALNFVYAFGAGALDHARQLGASPVWMSNLIAAPAVSGGFLANAVYCAHLLRRNRTISNFVSAEARVNWFWGALMGAFWFGGQALYGLGVYRMGSFGTVIGWPLLMGTIILTSNLAGIVTGEWTRSDRRVRLCLGTGMAIILVALWILSRAQQG